MVQLLQITTIQAGYPQVTDNAGLLDGCHPGRYRQTHLPQSILCRPPLWSDHSEAEQRFFFNGKRPADFNLTYHFPAAYLAAFPNAYLTGDSYIVVAADNRVIQDSYSGDHILQRNGRFLKQNLTVNLDGQTHHVPFALRRPAEAQRIEQRCLLPTHYWHFNYHHWLIECLPRFRPALEMAELADCPVIVPANLSPFQRQSLERLGLPAERWLPFDGGEWQVQNLLFPSIGVFAPAELLWVRGRCLQVGRNDFRRPPASAGTTNGGRYYISRADASVRRLVNEEEVAAYLQQQGFEILTLTGMSFAEQVERFAAAEIIIGPHGSGLTNLLFAPAGTTVIELMPHDQVNHCFWLMSNVLSLRYSFLSGRALSSQRDFAIPLPRLQNLLATLHLLL
jgi:capsular polysaccharide biosynthesis protein